MLLACLYLIISSCCQLSARATEEYELARKKVSNFINASDSREIVFTRNATEAINLVAYTWGLQNIKPDDEVGTTSLYFFSIMSFIYSSESLCAITVHKGINNCSVLYMVIMFFWWWCLLFRYPSLAFNISTYFHDLFQIAARDFMTTSFCSVDCSWLNLKCNYRSCSIIFIFIFFQILLTVAEHHSAIVPWQLVAQKTGAVLKFVELNGDEVPDVDNLKDMLSRKTKLVVVHHVSNVLGKFLCLKPFVLLNFFPYFSISGFFFLFTHYVRN